MRQIQRLPRFRLVPLDAALARLAASLASQYSLRGADAVYVATARRLKAPLITLDDEQLRRGQAVVTTAAPWSGALGLRTLGWRPLATLKRAGVRGAASRNNLFIDALIFTHLQR